jgi:hypothetical protein
MGRIKRIKLWTTAMCLLALGVSAAASDDDAEVRLRVLDETAPAGGLVQMKVSTYEVTPISGGRGWIRSNAAMFRGVEGIGIFATDGEVAGVAVAEGDRTALTYVTTEPFVTDDYPFLTVALRLRDDVAVGSRTQFTFDPSSLWNLDGTMVGARVEPGRVTVGGSVAVPPEGRRHKYRIGAGGGPDRDPVHAPRVCRHDRAAVARRQS